MITDEKLKEMVLNPNKINGAISYTDVEYIELLERYIYDLKGKNVKIERPISRLIMLKGNSVRVVNELEFFDELVNFALKYYANKFIESDI